MYKDKDITFLIDESDTVHAYEEMGRNSASNMSDQDSTASVLAGMNRVQQIEVVRGENLKIFQMDVFVISVVIFQNDVFFFFGVCPQKSVDCIMSGASEECWLWVDPSIFGLTHPSLAWAIFRIRFTFLF